MQRNLLILIGLILMIPSFSFASESIYSGKVVGYNVTNPLGGVAMCHLHLQSVIRQPYLEETSQSPFDVMVREMKVTFHAPTPGECLGLLDKYKNGEIVVVESGVHLYVDDVNKIKLLEEEEEDHVVEEEPVAAAQPDVVEE